MPTWAYESDIVAAAVAARLAGAPHASERAYVFGTLAQLGWPTDARDGEAARALGDRWTRFAASGSPVKAARPWDRAHPDHAHLLVLTNATDRRETGMTPALAHYFGLR